MTILWNRRRILQAGVGLPLAACASDRAATNLTSLIDQDLNRFIGMGIHRSGSAGDIETAGWIENELRATGLKVRRDAISIDTISDIAAAITLDATQEINAFPQFMPLAQSIGQTIRGSLATASSRSLPSGAIAIIDKPIPPGAYWTPKHQAAIDSLARRGAAAVAYAVDTPRGSVFCLNRDARDAPLPIPVLIVSTRDLSLLLQHTDRNRIGALTLGGRSVKSATYMVAARKSGPGRHLIVSTPLSGWFVCGAERGPGIALFLSLARYAARQNLPCTFLSTGGHEIGHLGMDAALASELPGPSDTGLWIHLGASIATYPIPDTGPTRVFAPDSLKDVIAQTLGENAQVIDNNLAAARGETGQIFAAGYQRLLGFGSGHETFHMPEDLGENIDRPRLVRLDGQLKALIAGVFG